MASIAYSSNSDQMQMELVLAVAFVSHVSMHE